jgi:hypothetical protein
MKFSIFKVDKFLQTLLRLEQWQERLAVTWEKFGLVWKIERKLAKLLMTTFNYRSPSYLFYG